LKNSGHLSASNFCETNSLCQHTQVTIFHKGEKQGINQQIILVGNRFGVELAIQES